MTFLAVPFGGIIQLAATPEIFQANCLNIGSYLVTSLHLHMVHARCMVLSSLALCLSPSRAHSLPFSPRPSNAPTPLPPTSPFNWHLSPYLLPLTPYLSPLTVPLALTLTCDVSGMVDLEANKKTTLMMVRLCSAQPQSRPASTSSLHAALASRRAWSALPRSQYLECPSRQNRTGRSRLPSTLQADPDHILRWAHCQSPKKLIQVNTRLKSQVVEHGSATAALHARRGPYPVHAAKTKTHGCTVVDRQSISRLGGWTVDKRSNSRCSCGSLCSGSALDTKQWVTPQTAQLRP